MDIQRNILLQLGSPLEFTLGGSQTASYDAAGNITLSSSAVEVQNCAVSKRVIEGSFMVAWQVTARLSAVSSGIFVGVVPAVRRETIQQRRPVNTPRPQDWTCVDVGSNAIGLANNGSYFVNGANPGLVMDAVALGETCYMLYDAAAQTLTFRKNDPISGPGFVATGVRGPFQIVVRNLSNGFAIKMMHDIDTLPRVAGYRPAGVWHRSAMMGFMDSATGKTWDGRIDKDGDPTYEIAAGFHVMGSRSVSRAVGDITLVNTPEAPGSEARALDDLMLWDVRDEPLTLYRGSLGENASSYSVVARAVVEAISQPSENKLAVTCRDPSAKLDVPWQAESYAVGDSSLPSSLWGKSKPTVMGTSQAVGFVLRGSSTLTYDVADEPMRVDPTAAYDKGVALTAGVGYSLLPDRKSVRRLTNPEGLQCLNMAGGLLDAFVGIGTTTGDFVQWGGTPAAPRGWTNQCVSPATASLATGGGLRLVRTTSGTCQLLCQTPAFDAAGTYRIDLDIGAAAGSVSMHRTNAIGSSGFNAITITAAYANTTKTVFLTLPGAPGSTNYFRFYSITANTDITIKSIRISRVVDVYTVGDSMRFAATYRGQLSDGDLDLVSLNATQSWNMSYVTGADDSSTVIDALDAFARSSVSAWWFGSDGKLRMTLLSKPENAPSAVALIDDSIIGDVTSSPDRAPNLSTRAAGLPTWTVHQESDIAGSLNTTDAGRQLAASLKSEYSAIEVSSLMVAAQYKFAESAAPYPTLQVQVPNLQSVLSSLVGPYTKPRRIYTVAAAFDDALAIQPGSFVDLVDAGVTKRTLVLSVRGKYSSDVAELNLWG